jgi:hypothetical protein
MSFQSVWGFDPDEMIRTQKLGPLEPNAAECDYDSLDQGPLAVPLDVHAQIYELRRTFGL